MLGITLNSVQTPLYRFLEGYLWPQAMQDRRIQVQQAAKQKAKAFAQSRPAGLRRLLALETRYARFPIREKQVAPTRLGNAIRRMEEYGHDRYRLDSQVLWEELWSCSPDALTLSVDRARARVDFFVCLTYLSVLFALATLVVAFSAAAGATALLLAGLATASALSSWAWYRLAISMTDEWYNQVKALVNVGRYPLAQSLGLAVPATLEDERTMWVLVKRFVMVPYEEQSDSDRRLLDQYRLGSAPASLKGSDDAS